jgi:hypothetical protein
MFHGDSFCDSPPERIKHAYHLLTSCGYLYNQPLNTDPKSCQKDVLLPCILSMDKTNCDTFSCFAMEPLTVSYGLMKWEVCKSPHAMRILGYINHAMTMASKEIKKKNQTNYTG